MKEFLKKAFPFISAAASLGGPLGSMAANGLGAALGMKEGSVKPTIESIGEAIAKASADPELLLRAEQAERDFALQAQRLGCEHAEHIEQVAAADRANARAREISVKDRTNKILAYGVTGGFFICIFWLFRYDLPASTRDTVLVLFGALTKMTGDVFAYYFGSSAGSVRKTELIANGNGKH